MVERPARDILAADTRNLGKRLVGNTAVLELAQHQLVMTGQEGARGVAGVAGLQLFPANHGEQVVNEDGRLGADGGRGLGVGKRRRVTDGEDIRVLVVLRGGLVDIDPASRIGQRGFGDKVEGLLRGSDVEEAEFLLNFFAVVGQVLEGGNLALGVDSDQVVLEQAFDLAFDAELFKCLGVLWHGEHG